MFGSSPDRVATVLVGHSMGGAAAVWAAASKRIPSLDGVVVIDVVEGTALGTCLPACLPASFSGMCGPCISYPADVSHL
jgi:pimeloyl-ACP methyl ester carboxylesterase